MNSNNIIIFGCKNHYEDIGLLLLKNKNKDDEVELHLYNSFTCDSMMILNIKDLAKLCSALSGYFEKIIEI